MCFLRKFIPQIAMLGIGYGRYNLFTFRLTPNITFLPKRKIYPIIALQTAIAGGHQTNRAKNLA